MRQIAAWVAAVLLGMFVVATSLFVWLLEQRPDLDVWHLADLDEEFTTRSEVVDLAGYLELEERLFEQLEREVYDVTGPAPPRAINRYRRGSLADPARWARDWNRSFVFEREDPEVVVLMLHGLSDSPYSLRNPGRRLHAAGAHVLGLRIPGHGTAPSGLVEVRWQDMAAATRLAVDDLSRRFPNRPLYLVGYSNGAALALNHSLDAIETGESRIPDGLMLISPSIAISGFAAFAVWQARLGHWLGLDKLAWNDILLEYDPFKYGSFAVNAGDVSHRITRVIQEKLAQLGTAGLDAMPPILAFSSVVDATVEAPALVERLFNPLPPGGHELVLFDINRQTGVEDLMSWQPDAMIRALHDSSDREYRLTFISNENDKTPEVSAWRIGSDDRKVDETPLGVAWPDGVLSLSHVALGFPVSDPLYGAEPSSPSPGVALGNLALRGERGALRIPESHMLRQRWNPFYPYLEQRLVEFVGLDD